jgi:hypothetical protein
MLDTPMVKSYCAIDNTWLGVVLRSQEHADSKSVSALSLSPLDPNSLRIESLTSAPLVSSGLNLIGAQRSSRCASHSYIGDMDCFVFGIEHARHHHVLTVKILYFLLVIQVEG